MEDEDDDEDDLGFVGTYRIENPEGETYDVDAFYDVEDESLFVHPYSLGKHKLRSPEEWEAEQINSKNRISWRRVNEELSD